MLIFEFFDFKEFVEWRTNYINEYHEVPHCTAKYTKEGLSVTATVEL